MRGSEVACPRSWSTPELTSVSSLADSPAANSIWVDNVTLFYREE